MKMKFNEFIKRIGKPYKAYTGRESGCRCGCQGRYFDEGEVGFKRALNKITKLNPDVIFDELACYSCEIPVGEAISNFTTKPFVRKDYYVDMCLPNDKTITIFFEKK